MQLTTNKRETKWDRARHRDLLLSGVMLILMVLLQSRSYASAEEVYESLGDIGTGALVAKGDAGYVGLIRLGSDIDLDVNGMLAHAQVRQHFQNDTQDWVEATYVFPLPNESAVNRMRIQIGDRIIEGEIKERQQARKIFVAAKRQGKQVGLLEQQRPNLFTTRVANIGPGETVTVEFSYLQSLQYANGEFSLRVPLTITPRYIPGGPVASDHSDDEIPSSFDPNQFITVAGWSFPTDQVADAHEITPPQVIPTFREINGMSHVAAISVALAPGFELAEILSPYHDISTQRQSADYLVSPKLNPVQMNRDFVLTWRPVAQQAPTAAVFRENKAVGSDGGSTDHALIMVMPPMMPSNDMIPPRELIIIIDTSGSMAGASIVQAKKAVLMALDRLRPQDRFNVIEFNSRHRPVFAVAQPANTQFLNQAKRFVDQLRATGGTEMYGALNAAFQSPKDERFLRQVVFITDGSVGNESALFGLIHQSLGNSRLYTVGIGSAPNEFFMRKAAEFGKGTFSMIGSEQEVHKKMATLFGKIEKPVMTNLSVSAVGAKGDYFPIVIPDLYQGEPLVVNAKFDQWPQQITVSGEFKGEAWQQMLTLTDQPNSVGVATLWAREKVQALEDAGVSAGQRDKHKADVTQLGLQYGIVTRFTSFIAVAKEAVRPLTNSLKAKTVPNLMPAGSQQKPPSVGMPKTALGITQMFMLGLLCVFIALMLWVLKYSCHFFAIRCAAAEARS